MGGWMLIGGIIGVLVIVLLVMLIIRTTRS
jgi:hypothetical protein